MQDISGNIISVVAIAIFIGLLLYVKITNPHNKKITTQYIMKGYFRKNYCPKCNDIMSKSWKKLVLYQGPRAEGYLKYLQFHCSNCGYSTSNKDFYT